MRFSSRAGAPSPRVNSRASISRASLASTSPAWMLPNSNTTTLPLSRASAGVEIGGSANTITGMSRPSTVLPMLTRRAFSDCSANASSSSTTCKWVDVSLKSELSATVSSPAGAGGTQPRGGSPPATATVRRSASLRTTTTTDFDIGPNGTQSRHQCLFAVRRGLGGTMENGTSAKRALISAGAKLADC